MADSLKRKTAHGVIWSAIERFSTQGVQFLFGIILARMLTPADYGVIAMLTIFLAVSQTFIDSGFANAIIRKIDRTEKDMATMFFFNIGMALVCYAVIFFTAPLISDFYKMPELTLVLRVLALRLIFQSFNAVQTTTLTIQIDFKKQAKISLSCAILSGIVGIFFAYRGYGVWALVIQSLFSTILTSALYWFLVRWRPTCFFSKDSFKYLFSYGSKLLLSGLIDTAYNNIYPLIIGKFYTPAQLGGYSKAEHFAQFPSLNITRILQRVSFPILSKMQDDCERMRKGYLKFLNMSTFIVFPLMMGLFALSKPLVLTFLTEKWIDMVILLQLLCISMMWYPVHAINLNLLQVLGRSDLFLKLEIIKKIVGISVLCITLPQGLIVMCIGKIVTAFISLYINTYYSGKLMKAGLGTQLKFVVPTFINSLIMAGIILGVNSLLLENQYLLQLIVGFCVGVLYYFLSSYFCNKSTLKEILSMVQRSHGK